LQNHGGVPNISDDDQKELTLRITDRQVLNLIGAIEYKLSAIARREPPQPDWVKDWTDDLVDLRNQLIEARWS
jgi:hypothetical protein